MLEQVPENASDFGLQFLRRGEATSQWQLPDQDQVKAWKRERDEVEEQVLEFDGGDLERMKTMTRGETYTGTGSPLPANKRVSRYITSPDTTIDTPRVHHSGSYRLDRPYHVSVTAAWSHPRFGNASAPVGSGSMAGDE